MLKGHTKIELSDIYTGEKEVREYDNMITNAVPNFLVNTWAFGNASLNDASKCGRMNATDAIPNPMLDKFGGIYLFQNELTENANAYDFPTDNKLIGCAGMNNSSNNECQQIGSYNSVESGIDYEEKKISLVYDFTTSQANGQIKAVALTHTEAGSCPIQGEVLVPNENLTRTWSSNIVTIPETIKQFTGMQSYNGDKQFILPNGNVMTKHPTIDNVSLSDLLLTGGYLKCVGYTDEYMVLFNLIDTSTLQLIYVYEEMAKASIMNRHNGTYLTVAKIETVELSVAMTLNNVGSFGISDGVMVLFNCNYDTSNTINLYMINLGTGDAAYKQVVLPTNYTAAAMAQINNDRMIFANGKVVVCGRYEYVAERVDYGMIISPFVIDVQTGVSSKVTFPFFDNYRTLYPTATVRYIECDFVDILSKNWALMSLSNASNYNYFALNLATMVAYPVLGRSEGSLGSLCAHTDPAKASTQYGRLVAHRTYYNEIITGYEKSCHYLATINNLTSPVVKTADKTMKVTYTLQEV